MNITRVRGSSRNCEEYINNNHNLIGVPQSITCYEVSANFMLDSCDLLESQPTMILENTKGDFWYFESLNCGYSGTGPSATQKVLQKFGVSTEEAHAMARSYGFRVSFKNALPFSWYQLPCLFGYFNKPAFCCTLNDWCIADAAVRQVYFVNPQRHDPAGFFNCLLWMKPYNMKFNLGKESLSDKSIGVIAPYVRRENEAVEYCNLVIEGYSFTLYCYIHPKELRVLVQSVSLFLSGKPLFRETTWKNKLVFLSNENAEETSCGLKHIFSLFSPSQTYFEIPIKDIRKKGC